MIWRTTVLVSVEKGNYSVTILHFSSGEGGGGVLKTWLIGPGTIMNFNPNNEVWRKGEHCGGGGMSESAIQWGIIINAIRGILLQNAILQETFFLSTNYSQELVAQAHYPFPKIVEIFEDGCPAVQINARW